MKRKIYVLVACECSQVVTAAMRSHGAIAFSCDVQPCYGGHPDWHILGSCLPYLHGEVRFRVQSGKQLHVPRWDLIIAHPPCTYLSVVQSPLIFKGRGCERHVIDESRYSMMKDAVKFFRECLNAQARYLVVENPQIMLHETGLPRPNDCVSPHYWGSRFSKRTWLWLKNLPPLIRGVVNPAPKSWVFSTRGSRKRSQFFPEVAEAMATQYLSIVKQQS